jgi:hypothetical protein
LGNDYFYKTLAAISDIESVSIFEHIAHSSPFPVVLKNVGNGNNCSPQTSSSKQFYFRISALINAGVIKRDRNTVFSLTSFGKVVYNALSLVELASYNYERLRAIDSAQADLRMDVDGEENNNKIVDILIDNRQIKDILLAEESEP